MAKHRYVDCKECSHRITLQIYSEEAVAGKNQDEILTCPACLKEFAYSGDDFQTAKLF